MLPEGTSSVRIRTMLVLTRRIQEAVKIGDEVTVIVLGIHGS
jgi:hypothetical protein